MVVLTAFTPTSVYQYQGDYPQHIFRSPLDIPIKLAGTFGELRNNHFHMGIDCKTNRQENLNIYAIEGGYVSRIKVSPGGYGTALYIDHLNGYTSVYAHLNRFNAAIQEYIEFEQYQRQTFRIDIDIPHGILPVEKGQVVAKSGNTGSSTAPHLHFEIRDTYTEEALNPLLFGFAVQDTRKPIISGIGIYPFDENGRDLAPKVYKVTKDKQGRRKIGVNTIKINAQEVGLGIKAYDKQNGADNLNGIYSLEVLDNGTPIYYFDVEKISFEETRCINSHIDFHRYKSGQGRMQKCFVDPGNRLTTYDKLSNNGVINISDGLPHKITYIVKDIKGNASTLSHSIQYDPKQAPPSKKTTIYNAAFSYQTDNYFSEDSIDLYFPSTCFYKDILFTYKKTPTSRKKVYSAYHELHSGKTPVHAYFDVSLHANMDKMPYHLRDKALIIHKNTKGRAKSLGGEWEGDYLKAKSREFGRFYIMTDTIPPRIKPINISNGKNLSQNKTITLTIGDNLAGVQSFNGYIDDQWVLMSYDGKTGKVRYRFDGKRVGKGKHTFRLEVTDGRGNFKEYTANFRR